MIKNSEKLEKKYIIYSYIFDDNKVYVGLTNNINRRHYEHLNNINDNLYKFCINNNYKLPDINILEKNLNKYEAQSKEENWLKYYLSLDFILINKAKCGLFTSSLGFSKKENEITNNNEYNILNEKYDICYNNAKKYTKLYDFRKNHINDYAYARKYGWLKDFYWLEKTQPKKSCKKKITDDIFFDECSKYSSRSDLALNNKSFYNYGLKNNLLDIVYPKNNKIFIKKNEYDISFCINEMKKYNSSADLRISDNKLYLFCRDNNLLDFFKNKGYVYNKVIKNNMNDINLTNFLEINYNGINYYLDTINFILYKKLKTKINGHVGVFNKNGIYCFKLNGKFIPYHDLLLGDNNLVIYKDGDFSNLKSENLIFTNIDLENDFKALNELSSYYINKLGDIYSFNEKIFVKKEIVNNEYYYKSFNVSKLLCKYWLKYNEFKLFDVIYKDGNSLNLSLSNLLISNKKNNINNIKINEINEHYEIYLKDFFGIEYFIGSISNKKILNQVKNDLKSKIYENKNISEWVDEYRNDFIKWKNDDEVLSNIKLRTESNGCYWSEIHKKWKSKIYYNTKEYSLGYFDLFEIGKVLYEEGTLMIKYGIFDKWYKNIKEHRNRIISLFE